jgi:cysteine desulfurase
MHYFDHNASSVLLPEAREAWLRASADFYGNPSSLHRLGARADRALSDARERLAALLKCEPEEIVWTSGATESNNTVFHHFAKQAPPNSEIWVSSLEHPSVLQPSVRYFGARRRLIPASKNGTLDLNWLEERLQDHRDARPALIIAMAANNETGVLQPWPEISKLCKTHEVPFFCDAVQWIGKLPVAGLGSCEFVSGSAHKFGGPRGTGFLKCPQGIRLDGLLLGGPQEDGHRAGTENVPGVLSMMAALEVRETALARGEASTREIWRTRFEDLLEQILPGAEVIGQKVPRLWNTVSALMPVATCRQRWVVKLDKAGYAVSTGSACSSGEEKPSHVLLAMGMNSETAGNVLRFSSGWSTTPVDWTGLAETLARVHRDFLQENQPAPAIVQPNVANAWG